MKTENKYLEKILKKQCKMVGADFSKMDFKKDGWFNDYVWTEEQEKRFCDWLMDYIKDRKVWRNLTDYSHSNKKLREKFAQNWNFSFGWETKYD